MRFSADQRCDENHDPEAPHLGSERRVPPGSVRVEEDVMGYFPEGGHYCFQLLPDEHDSRYFTFRFLLVDGQNHRLRLSGRGCRETTTANCGKPQE